MEKSKVYVMHSSHLDLYWIGAQADCLEKGAIIIDNALARVEKEPSFHFLIETARFLEYYSDAYPERLPALRDAFARGQFEMAASYSDRLENHVGGEALVRNALYGRKIIRKILGFDCDLCCHPDLPGFAEQTPQIYKKSGIRYYLSARGFRNGGRFHWLGLDGSDIIMYNIPGHYAYYDVDKVVSEFEQTKQNIGSDAILLGCSAGDMGAAGTFVAKVDGKSEVYDIGTFLREVGERYPQYEFTLANAHEVLERMPKDGLASLRGEYPSRWGHHGSAMNVQFYQLDKQVDRALTDAEKLTTVCALLGKPVSVSFERHPLKDPGGNGGERRYWDLRITPDSVAGWLEYAWRLQLTTQDHNFGGVEGAQTEFDRMIYKRAALKIADAMIEESLATLSSLAAAGKDMVAVTNTMNWTRDEIVTVPDMALENDRNFVAVDDEGHQTSLVYSVDGWQFLAGNIPSMGMRTYRVEPGVAPQTANAQVFDTTGALTVQNPFYRIIIDKQNGCVESFLDRSDGKEWMRGGRVLDIIALRDDSLGGSEHQVNKQVLDTSAKNVRSVRLRRSDALMTQVQVVSEVLDVKVYQTITLRNDVKRMSIRLDYNWPGTPDIQLKMALCKRGGESKIIYGVPYGAQEYGQYLETESLRFGDDEISYELFNRYREVQGFFAVEEEGSYLSVASNQSAYDFIPGGAYVLLARDVRNGAERDYRFTNAGQTSFEFVFTTGKGCPAQASHVAWERQYPVYVRRGTEDTGRLSAKSWLDTQGTGVLTVLAPSMQGNGAVARLYNPIQDAMPLRMETGLGLSPAACVNMDETPADEPLDVLGGFEIKTVLLRKEVTEPWRKPC